MTFLRVMVAAAALAGGAVAQADRPAKVDRIVADTMKQQQIPAMTVAIGIDGRIVYSKGAGTADLENSVPATTLTLIRTGSIAKPITAAATMALVDAGRLDLDVPVQKYCAAFPEKQWPVTTRELLSHTAGVRHYRGAEEILNTHHYKTMADAFAIFGADPLLFEPGTAYSYSTYGYTVVGCVVEGASGEKFSDYVAEHVLRPAGMAHTFIDDLYEIVPHRARGYRKTNGQVQNADLMDSSYKIPSGGYVTTAEDLVRFGEALMEEKIVKPATLATMWTPSQRLALEGGKRSNYGLGFGVMTIDGVQYVAHTGSQQGTSTAMAILPSRRFVVAAMANMDGVDPGEVVRGVLELYDLPYPNRGKK